MDIPNERSSHEHRTIRGGGIIIPIAGMIGLLLTHDVRPEIFLGLMVIAVMSFLDDLYTIKPIFRITAQFMAVGLIGLQYPVIWILPILIIGVGFINTYNFMDGINGITSLYSLVVLASLYYLQTEMSSYYIIIGSAVVVFSYFNFRPRGKAIAFMGDVGSISMGMLILIPLVSLIYIRQDISLVLLVGVYGVDSVVTILIRLIRRENIFEAHRLHLYQLLCNDHGKPHLLVSASYTLAQLLVSIIYVNTIDTPLFWLVIILILVAVYAMVRFVWLHDTLSGKK